MAFRSLPNQSVTVPLSHQQFETLQKAVFGIDNLLHIVQQASWGIEGSVAWSMERLLAPFTHDLSLLRESLEEDFDRLEKARQAEDEDRWTQRTTSEPSGLSEGCAATARLVAAGLAQEKDSCAPESAPLVARIISDIDKLAGRTGGAAAKGTTIA